MRNLPLEKFKYIINIQKVKNFHHWFYANNTHFSYENMMIILGNTVNLVNSFEL